MIRRTIRTGFVSVAALALMTSLALAQNQTSNCHGRYRAGPEGAMGPLQLAADECRSSG